jgi:hypothetical protein
MAGLSSRTTVMAAAVCVALAWTISPHVRAGETAIKIVVLGDSLTAGYGVSGVDAFPAKLEHALRTGGRSVVVANAGVSGDTASIGLARLNRSITAARCTGRGEECVLAIEHDGADAALDNVGVELDAAIVQEAGKPVPVVEAVTDLVGDLCLDGDAAQTRL